MNSLRRFEEPNANPTRHSAWIFRDKEWRLVFGKSPPRPLSFILLAPKKTKKTETVSSCCNRLLFIAVMRVT